jgi:hypothetical protein
MTFSKYGQGQNIRRPNNLKVFGSKKTKGHKQDIHYFLSSDTESGDFAVILP